MKSFEVWNHTLKGQYLIEASAGTGKTYTLAGLYLRHLLESESLLPENILVLTFTNAATAELRNRLRSLLSQAKQHLLKQNICEDDSIATYLDELANPNQALKKLKTALLSFDQAAVFTIHGFCKTVISDMNAECGSPAFHELIDSRDYLQKWVYGFYRRQHQQVSSLLMNFAPKPDSVIKKLSSLLSKRHFEDAAPLHDWQDFVKIIENLKDLQTQWLEQKEILMDYLLAGYLPKNSYHPDKRQQYIQQIDCFFQGQIVKNAKNYTASHIQSKFLKNAKPTAIPTFFQDFETLLEQVYDLEHNVNLVQLSFVHACWQSIKQQQQQLFLHEGKFSFDHLVETVAQACENSETLCQNIAEQWPLLLVDEFQDTDSLQWSIFDNCFLQQNNNMVLVGDPKQAIYDFRGGDVFVYQKAKQKIKKHYNLSTNWRSSQQMLAISNQFFDFESSFQMDWIHFKPSLACPQKSQLLDSISTACIAFDVKKSQRLEHMSTEIQRLLTQAKIEGKTATGKQSRKLQESDIAILVNSNYEAKEVYNFLLLQGLNVSLWSDDSVMQSDSATDLYFFIRALLHPNIRNINTSLHSSFYAKSLAEIHAQSPETHISRFIDLKAKLQNQPLALGLQSVIRAEKIDLQLLSRPDGERRWMDLQHLLEIIAALSQSLSLSGLLEWLDEEMNQNSSVNDEEKHKRKLESDGNKITIQTLHKSKGLEYGVVFLPFADSLKEKISSRNSGTYKFVESLHDHKWNGYINWQVNKNCKEQIEEEHIGVQRRKMYVAMTRSKYRLYLGLDSEYKTTQSQFENTTIAKILENSGVNPSTAPVFSNQKSDKNHSQLTPLTNSEFHRKLSPPRRTSSFSALNNAQNSSHQAFLEDNVVPEMDYNNHLHFPKGASSGDLIHKILEILPFNSDLAQIASVVAEQLQRRQIDLQWLPALSQQMKTVLHSPLWNGGPCLQNIENYIVEMEFLLPFQQSNINTLSAWLTQHREQAVEFDFESIKGYLSGFIDLVFEWRGQYFVLDYKSNHLGYSHSDYHQENLKNCIREHNYDLQYLLYSTALVRSLKLRKPDFQLSKDFGGVVYLFTRGANGKAANGMYFNRPSDDLLNKMQESFR